MISITLARARHHECWQRIGSAGMLNGICVTTTCDGDHRTTAQPGVQYCTAYSNIPALKLGPTKLIEPKLVQNFKDQTELKDEEN